MRLLAFSSRQCIVLTLTLLLLPFPAWAGDDKNDRATLKGITTLAVIVGKIDPEAQADGLERSQIQTDVELRLQQSGINVVSRSGCSSYLYVSISTMKAKDISLYAYSVDVQLKQGVILLRDETIINLVPTWERGFVGMVGVKRISQLRSDVIDLVDRFINAYLEQNPKQ